MDIKTVYTFWINIYIAGDYERIKHICSCFCFDKSFCVTVTKTTYTYLGGTEDGVIIGLINYPRFPKTEDGLISIADELANKIMVEENQLSYTIMNPHRTIFYSRYPKDSRTAEGR